MSETEHAVLDTKVLMSAVRPGKFLKLLNSTKP